MKKKIIYNTDNKISGAEWVRKDLKGIKLVECVQLSSFNKVKSSNINNIAPNSIGYFLIQSNNIRANNLQVAILSSASSNRGGVSIIDSNFLKVTSFFAARKCIQRNWINCKDEYIAPNEEHPKFDQFKFDSLVYSLFNNHSQQSSLRQVEYKGKLWEINNQFFWIK